MTEIVVLDQQWKLNMGPLPQDKVQMQRLNQTSKTDPSSPKINELLQGKNFSPCSQILNQMQFFNSFNHMAFASENSLRVLNLTHFTQYTISTADSLRGYKCLMILQIDPKGKFCYILG